MKVHRLVPMAMALSLSTPYVLGTKAVAFTSPAPMVALKNFQSEIGYEFALTGRNSGQLDQGSILLNPPEAITLETPNCKLVASPNSAIIATVKDQMTKIFNLSGDFDNPCKVIVGTETLSLPPGSEVDVLSDSLENTRTFMTQDSEVPRKIISSKAIGKDLSVVQSQFSIATMLKNNPMLVDIGKSDTESDQVLYHQIEKTAVVVEKAMQTTASGGAARTRQNQLERNAAKAEPL